MNHLAHNLALIACLATSPLAMAASETRDLPPFASISSQGVYRLVVTAGQKQSVVVDGEPAVLAKVKTTVSGDHLVISMTESKNHQWKDKVHITIGVPQLNAFQFEGVGDTRLVNLAGEQFRLSYQGVGSLTVTGQVQKFAFKAEGVGNLDARALNARSVEAHLQGVGSAEVRATESLDASVEGVGSLTYYGKPKQVIKNVQGVGRVRAGD